jgi:hypothetical protein
MPQGILNKKLTNAADVLFSRLLSHLSRQWQVFLAPKETLPSMPLVIISFMISNNPLHVSIAAARGYGKFRNIARQPHLQIATSLCPIESQQTAGSMIARM